MQWATLAFTVTSGAMGGTATIASLLTSAHSRLSDTLLTFTLQDAEGTPFRAILTSMDFERWLQDSLLARRTKQHKQLQKQIAQESKGKVRATIKHLPGRPLLSKEEADAMFSGYFMGHTEPRQVDQRDSGGLKVEGYYNTTWGAYVEPMGAWPIKIQHPLSLIHI